MKTAMMIDGRPFITSISSCDGRALRRPAYSERKSAISTPNGIAIRVAKPTITPVPTRFGPTPLGAGWVMNSRLIALAPWLITAQTTITRTATAGAAATARPRRRG